MTVTTLAPTLIEVALCDSCGVPAAQLVTLVSGGTLTFCQHHYDRNHEALAPLVADVAPSR